MTATLLGPTAVLRTTDPPTEHLAERVIKPPRGFAIAALLCAAMYALLGMWTISRSGFMIGDAAYRVANARTILFSRDPHLAAIGMTWMPLSTLATLPFTAVLQPLGLGWASGTMMSAAFGGGTIWMLAKAARFLDASVTATVLALAMFALNPVNVFWMGSAMMEPPSIFFLAWACTAYLRWLRDRSTTDLAIIGAALGLGVGTRYEQVAVTIMFAGLVWLACEKARRRHAVVFVALPSLVVLVVWCCVNQVIRGDFLAFLTSGRSADIGNCGFLPISLRRPDQNIYDWCELKLSLMDSIEFGAQRVLRFAPIVVLGAPVLLIADLRRRFRSSPVLGITAGILAGPAFITLLTWRERTTGNPRYFYAAILLAPFLCLLVAGRLRPYGRAWFPVLGAVMALGVVTSVHMELQELFAGVEHEEAAIGELTGLRPDLLDDTTDRRADKIPIWREAAAQIDELTSDGDLIAMDSSTTFQVLLFSQHLDRFAIPEDRDFEQLLSLTESKFTYIVVTGSADSSTGIDQRLADIVAGATAGQSYQQVAELIGVGQLWKLNEEGSQP